MAARVAWYFRRSIRRYSDPFSMRLLFAVLSGHAPSLLELADRPAAYDNVGHLCRWGMVIPELRSFGSKVDETTTIESHVVERAQARQLHLAEIETAPIAKVKEAPPAARRPVARRSTLRVRPRKVSSSMQYLDRRGTSLMNGDRATRERRRASDRRKRIYNIPFPDRRLTRSAYEQVFLKLVSGGKLRMGDGLYSPVGMKGWYHAVFRRDSDGTELLLTIDQLLRKMSDWM
jgi:hypothetical protein